MPQLPEMSLGSGLILLVLIFVGHNLILWTIRHLSTSAPAIDQPWFALLFGKSQSTRQLIRNAYYKYSKNSRIFRVGGHYIIPPSAFADSRKALASVLSSNAANDDNLKFGMLMGYDHVDVVNFVKTDVTRNIDNLIPAIRDELNILFKRDFSPTCASKPGNRHASWRQVTLYPTMLTGIGCVATRILAGEKYSRNVKFTRTASDFAIGVIYQSVFLKTVPRLLIPILIRIMPTRFRIDRLKEMIRDDVMHYITDPAAADQLDKSVELKETKMLPFLVKYVQAADGYAEASPEKVLRGTIARLMGMMFAAIDTTTMTSTHALFDIVSHPYEEYAEPLKKELTEVLAKHNGELSHKALLELRLMDSFIKESQRLNPVGEILPTRMVMQPQGFKIDPPADAPGVPSVNIPRGTTIMMPLSGIHSDPSIYTEPETFQGFRFAEDAIPSSQPSDKFLSFGHGRHACPGRILALAVVKLVLIEFLTRYDYEVLQERPENFDFGFSHLPNMKAMIRVREHENEVI